MRYYEGQLAHIFFRGWWLLLLRGLAAIGFGVLAWLQPGITLSLLVLLFGAFCLIDGVLGVLTAVLGRGEGHGWVFALWGLAGIGVGLLAFAAPGVTAFVLLFYIAIWAIVTGVLEIAAAILLRREIEGEWMLILVGLASIGFGAVLMARPEAGALALLWLIAAYATVFGVLLVILAFEARRFGRRLARF